jgi:hypothetical protein
MKRRPWVLHESFDAAKWHFSSTVKALITGEPVQANIKHGAQSTIRFTAPIFWDTNSPPQFKEATKAIVNRLVVIKCNQEFVEGKPVGAAKEALRRKFSKPSELVLADEMPGLLAWAMAGLRRALERGSVPLTEEMIDVLEDIRRDSNIVAGFMADCVTYDPDCRVSVPDFGLAHAMWWRQNKGDDRGIPSSEAVGRAMVALADPMIALDPTDNLRNKHRRYYAGVVLNDEGLGYHEAGRSDDYRLKGRLANTTEASGAVNSAIPASWLDKPSVKKMRERQGAPPAVPGVETKF